MHYEQYKQSEQYSILFAKLSGILNLTQAMI